MKSVILITISLQNGKANIILFNIVTMKINLSLCKDRILPNQKGNKSLRRPYQVLNLENNRWAQVLCNQREQG